MKVKRVFRKFHLWLSIPAGVIITLMCLTGAILVFENEFLQLTHPERYKVGETTQPRLPLDEIVERVNSELVDDEVVAMQVYSNPDATMVATLASGARSHAYVDPHSAEIKGYYNHRAGFFYNVMRLHRWLMFKDFKIGRTITGVSTIFFVFILISGIVSWFPRNGAPLKRYFIIMRGARARRRTFDLHRILGLYAAIALLVLSLTGLMWSFDWYKSGVGKLLGVEQSSGRGGGSAAKESDEESTLELEDWWQSALTAAQNQIPNSEYVRVSSDGTVAALSNDAPHWRAVDNYRYDNGKIETVSIYGEQKNSYYMMTWAYSLHVGSWGGVWSQLLVFFAALIGASLPITGYMMWYRRLKSKNNRRKSIK